MSLWSQSTLSERTDLFIGSRCSSQYIPQELKTEYNAVHGFFKQIAVWQFLALQFSMEYYVENITCKFIG